MKTSYTNMSHLTRRVWVAAEGFPLLGPRAPTTLKTTLLDTLLEGKRFLTIVVLLPWSRWLFNVTTSISVSRASAGRPRS